MRYETHDVHAEYALCTVIYKYVYILREEGKILEGSKIAVHWPQGQLEPQILCFARRSSLV